MAPIPDIGRSTSAGFIAKMCRPSSSRVKATPAWSTACWPVLPVPVAPAQNLRQLITRAAPPPRRDATVHAHHRSMPKLMQEWPAALALAASLAVGVWLGAAGVADDLLPSLLAGPVDIDTVALDPPDNLDFDSGGGPDGVVAPRSAISCCWRHWRSIFSFSAPSARIFSSKSSRRASATRSGLHRHPAAHLLPRPRP